MANYRCIYCLKEKDESQFNREHVVPRMMGTYENGFVLNRYQVCKGCNSYFSRELEDKIGLNSMESFFRMQYGRPMSDGRSMRNGRVTFCGTSGLFKGLDFTPVVDRSNEEKIRFNIAPKIGIMSEENIEEYFYYSLEDLPVATPELLSFLRHKERGIITIDIAQCVAEPVLKEKGYLSGEYTYQDAVVTDLYNETRFGTDIHFSIDSIVRRICAKTVFNYLCFANGKEYVLAEEFHELRQYIRYGIWSENLWFRYSIGPVSAVTMSTDRAHVVGYMFYREDDKWIICGCLTWFGELTYIFRMGDTGINVNIVNVLPCTKMACFDNENNTILEDEAVYVYPGSRK